MIQPLWRTVWRFLKKLKIKLPSNPAILLLGVYLEELKAETQTGICSPMLTAALITRAKKWKQPKCPGTDQCINKIWYIHRVEYYAAFKKENSDRHYNTDEP